MKITPTNRSVRAIRVPARLAEWSVPLIRALLKANCSEDGRFDWKEMFSPDPQGKERLVRCAAAMANAAGGFIIFGVKDDGSPTERVVGIPADKEFGRDISQQLHRADPPIPHSLLSPPLAISPGKVIQIVEILPSAAPHADTQGRYFVRSGGGADQPLKTHQLRALFRFQDVAEAPGLHEIAKANYTFLRGRAWDRMEAALETLVPFALVGTPRQKMAVQEALSHLAIHTRNDMPTDLLFGMLMLSGEVTPYSTDDAPDLFVERLGFAVEVAGHVGYDAALYLRHGFAVHTAARLLSHLLVLARKHRLDAIEKLVLDEFESCISAARRARPEPFLDAARWFEYKRDHPKRGVPPRRLDPVERRLLGVDRSRAAGDSTRATS